MGNGADATRVLGIFYDIIAQSMAIVPDILVSTESGEGRENSTLAGAVRALRGLGLSCSIPVGEAQRFGKWRE